MEVRQYMLVPYVWPYFEGISDISPEMKALQVPEMAIEYWNSRKKTTQTGMTTLKTEV